MKKTIFMLPALALLMFAACSSEDAVTKDNTAQLNETPDNAIGFDAYLNRTVTRAGAPGILVTSGATSGQVNLQDKGFGVFGYYANGDLYSENATPNFMYNQHVTYDGVSKWTYEPVKYWPNEFGSSAVSTGVDRVTFFAYAPYVGVDPTTGQLTTYYDDLTTEKSTTSGITSLTRNGKSGDPYVRYVGAFNPANCVDLCYGVAAADYKSSIGASDGANNVKKGEPYLNVAKPEINSKIYFDFKHALAKLTVQIDADVDIASHATSDALDGKTRVWVRSITFDGIAQRGYLNLNSGMWYEVMDNNKISHANVTIHDGRRDGAEAIADDSYESPTGFNENLIQKRVYTTESAADPTTGVTKYTTFDISEPGVTAAYQNLFAGSGSLLVIPANEQLKVTIVYDVETADATLPNYLSDGVTKGSTIENKITKNITLGGTALKLESGNAYTLNLHLGMNSVKFDAKVSSWEDGSNNDVDLPANVPIFVASTDGTNATMTLPYTAVALNDYAFGISGLNSGEAVSTDKTSVGPVTSVTTNSANASGLAIQSVAVSSENGTIMKKTGTITWTGASSGRKVALTVTQAPHPLELAVSEFDTANKKIKLKAGATPESGKNWNADGVISPIVVKRNGVVLTETDSDPNDNQFIFTKTAGATKADLGNIEVKTLKAGDVYTIIMKAGDADEETITCGLKESSISFSSPSVSKSTGDDNFTIEANNNGDGVVTYTSSKTNVATVNSTGEITLVGPGVTIITANVDDGIESRYAVKTATYKLIVSTSIAAANPNATLTINVDKDFTGEGTFTITGLTKDKDVIGVEANSWVKVSVSDNKVPSDGTIVVTYELLSTTTLSRNREFTIKDNDGTPHGVRFTITQE